MPQIATIRTHLRLPKDNLINLNWPERMLMVYNVPDSVGYSSDNRKIFAGNRKGEDFAKITDQPWSPLTTHLYEWQDIVYTGGSSLFAIVNEFNDNGSRVYKWRAESNNFGKTWTLEPEPALINTNLLGPRGTTWDHCYAGGGDVFTLRAVDVDRDGNGKQAYCLWSTDYGNSGSWDYAGNDAGACIVEGWNCRGIQYMGIDPEDGGKMLICAAGNNGVTLEAGKTNNLAVFVSKTAGTDWVLTKHDFGGAWGDATGDGFFKRTKFAYQGDGVVLLAETFARSGLRVVEVWRSEDYGYHWTKIADMPQIDDTWLQWPGCIPVSYPDCEQTYSYVYGFEYLGYRQVGHTEFGHVYYMIKSDGREYPSQNGYIVHGFVSVDGGYTWTEDTDLYMVEQWDDTQKIVEGLEFPVQIEPAFDNGAIPGRYA